MSRVTAQRGYAKCSGAHLAYSVQGDGPLDILHLTNTTVGIDALDEEPHASRYYRRLSSFARVVRFDQRGIGRSDPIDVSKPWTVDSMANDALAVSDAVGLGQAVVI
jgi:pimeloyl-ACP methyl ester carboxylesterase